MPVKIFYCYAREDKNFREELDIHFASLKHQGLVTSWHDYEISPGKDWKLEISNQLNIADIILLLISPNFMASDYCYSIEMAQALERHNRGEACVIPILLRPVDWENAPFSKLQVLPTGAKPITIWQNIDEAMLDITKSIRKVIYDLASGPTETDRKPSIKSIDMRLSTIEDRLIQLTDFQGLRIEYVEDGPYGTSYRKAAELINRVQARLRSIAYLEPPFDNPSYNSDFKEAKLSYYRELETQINRHRKDAGHYFHTLIVVMPKEFNYTYFKDVVDPTFLKYIRYIAQVQESHPGACSLRVVAPAISNYFFTIVDDKDIIMPIQVHHTHPHPVRLGTMFFHDPHGDLVRCFSSIFDLLSAYAHPIMLKEIE